MDMRETKTEKETVEKVSSLGYALMCLLARRDRSGYELSRFTRPPRNFLLWSAGHSQIYPELARLTKRGLVEYSAVARANRRDKKIYSLTEAGRARLIEWVLERPRPTPFRQELALKVHASWLGDPAQTALLIREQSAMAQSEIDMISAHARHLEKRYGQAFPPPADHNLFGTYANIKLAIATRRQLIEWCDWLEGELLAVADPGEVRKQA